MDEGDRDGGLGDHNVEPSTDRESIQASATDPVTGIEPAPVHEDVPASRRVALRAGLLLGIAGMLAGGLYFARSLVSSASGGATPTAAVERFFDALANEDAIGVLETMMPAERRLLVDPLQAITNELSRLRIFGPDANLADVNGLEIEIFGLGFKEEELTPGITAVVVNKGRVRSRFDPRGGLLGTFVTKLMDRDALSPDRVALDFAVNDVTIATQKDGDEWYVSVGYTIAENVRRESGSVLPSFGRGVAIGATTPEKAVEELLRAGAGLEMSRLLQLAPPGEAAALHDYAQLFITELGVEAHEMRGFFTAEVTNVDLSSKQTAPGVATVEVERIAFKYAMPDLGIRIEYDGECTVLRFEGEPPERICEGGAGPAMPFYLPFEEFPKADVGFIVVQERGEWFVSPTRTLLEGALGYLKAMDLGELDMLREFFEYEGGEFEEPILDPRATPTA